MNPDHQPAAQEDLLSRYRDGDRQAFRGLVEEFQDRVLQFFFRLCWNRDRAEDLTQDLFVRLLAASTRYQPQGKLPNLVWRTATNLWIDYQRAQKPRHRRAGPIDQVLADARSTQLQPLDQVVLDEERLALRGAMQQLSEPHRLVIELAVNQELPYREISELLDIPLGTVKSRMHHAIATLRRMLDPAPRAHQQDRMVEGVGSHA